MNDYVNIIKESVSVKDAASRYGIVFNRAGFACCPFHQEKTPSFKVRDHYYAHCFGCGKNADVFTVTMELLNLSFSDAIDRLNEDFLLGLPIRRRSTIRDRIEIAGRIRQVKSQTEAKQDEIRRLKEKYEKLLDLYCRYEIAIRRLRPKTPEDEVEPLFIEAVNNIDRVEYLLDSFPDIPK